MTSENRWTRWPDGLCSQRLDVLAALHTTRESFNSVAINCDKCYRARYVAKIPTACVLCPAAYTCIQRLMPSTKHVRCTTRAALIRACFWITVAWSNAAAAAMCLCGHAGERHIHHDSSYLGRIVSSIEAANVKFKSIFLHSGLVRGQVNGREGSSRIQLSSSSSTVQSAPSKVSNIVTRQWC